jgi:cellulose synthase (UDP-forming)
MEHLLVLLIGCGVALLVAPYLRRESTVIRFLIIGFMIAMVARYVVWRVWNMPRLELSVYSVASYAFFGMEMIATYMAIDDIMLLKRTTNRSPEVERQLDWYADAPPRVDILIATYNEPWEVLEKTIVGATSQNYSNYRVWILDDGNRAWLREKAATHDLGYVTRTNNAHYKAGNLNNALVEMRAQGVEPEFLALLDADFIARPEFLRRTLALMKSADIGIVQTPQCFYNPDPHQQAFGGVKNWPDEQRGWFDVYLPALDALGAATCCGTSCLIRMSALDAIGGFPTASVCEDTLTSLKMGPKGFRTVLLEERLTVGLAPEGIGEFLTQRARWLLGGVQNTRHMGAAPGVRGRIKYWLALWRHAIFGIMPPLWVVLAIVFWLTGNSLIQITDFSTAASYFGPLWLVRMFSGWLFRGRTQPFVSDAVWMLLSPLWVNETYRAIVGSKARFKVTDKALHRDKSVFHWRLLPFHASLLFGLWAGFAYNMLDPTAPLHHAGFFQANTWMTIWFTMVILAGVAPIIEGPKRRTADRYPASERVTAIVDGERLRWRCRNISLGGVLVQTDGCEGPPASLTLDLDGVGEVPASLVRTPSRGLAAFAFQNPEARPELIRKLYFGDEYIVAPERWGLSRPIGAFLKRLVF